MTPKPVQVGRLLLAISALAFAACFACVTLVPLVPYQPVCGLGRQERTLEGPLRSEFADQLVVALAQEGFRFRRNGDVVMVPYADVWPNRVEFRLAWRPRYEDLRNFQINVDRSLARNIANGQLGAGQETHVPSRTITPPAPLQAYLRSLEPELGHFPPARNDPIAGRAWADRFIYDCTLLRLALIRVEDRPDAPR